MSAGPDSVCLEPDSLSHSGEALEEGVQFAVWVSFYEIYNEFLYDLLDISPSLQPRKRVTLRLSDDKQGNPYVKGKIHSKRLYINTYVHMCFECATAASQSHLGFYFLLALPDLTWIQVRSAEEAWKILRAGHQNQSFASTHLNQNSSRR